MDDGDFAYLLILLDTERNYTWHISLCTVMLRSFHPLAGLVLLRDIMMGWFTFITNTNNRKMKMKMKMKMNCLSFCFGGGAGAG